MQIVTFKILNFLFLTETENQLFITKILQLPNIYGFVKSLKSSTFSILYHYGTQADRQSGRKTDGQTHGTLTSRLAN